MNDGERQHIHELFPKIRGVVNNMRALAEQLTEKRTTLESRLRSRTGLLSVAEQQALADAIGFKVTWPEWRDPEATVDDRRDTAERFLARFRKGAASLAVRVGKSEPIAAPFADFSLETTGQFHLRDDEPIPFFYEVSCEPVEVAKGLFVGLAGFEVRIGLPIKGGVWRHNDVTSPSAELVIRVGDERRDPCYRFSTNRPPMRFRIDEVSDAFGIYEGAKPGDVLQIEMRTYLDQIVVEGSDARSPGIKRTKVRNHLAKRFQLGDAKEGEDAVKLVGQTLIIEKLS